MTIILPTGLALPIREEGRRAFPEECCGLLIGREGEPRHVVETKPMENVFPGPRHNRYTIDPMKLVKADRESEARGLQLVGFYHSHPGAPAVPSEYDRSHAWPWYTFIIVTVKDRVPGEMTAWRLSDDRKLFNQEAIKEE